MLKPLERHGADVLDAAVAIRPGEEVPLDRLRLYLTEQLPELTGPLQIDQFPAGYSNLTYLLRVGPHELVLRRPPFGSDVKSAHDMGREFRVLSRLCEVYPPAPRPIAYCDEADVLGAPFYLMERRQGVILRRHLPSGVDLDRATMGLVCEVLIDNLARLHNLDYEDAGLGDLGHPQGYVERQVRGWASRYDRARTQDFEAMDSVAAWLANQLPVEPAESLIHNDYKFDNLMLDPANLSSIVAVLDWEMCTVGHPLMDLGATLAYWIQADDPEYLTRFVPGPTDRPGAMSRHQLMDRYAENTGRDLSEMLFFYCFGLFKNAVIVQQILYRYTKGLTQDPRFAGLDQVVDGLSRAAAGAIEGGRVP